MPHAPDVGDVAPQLEGPLLDGGWFRLSDHRERPTDEIAAAVLQLAAAAYTTGKVLSGDGGLSVA